MRRLLIMFLIAAAAVQGYKEFFGRPVALAEESDAVRCRADACRSVPLQRPDPLLADDFLRGSNAFRRNCPDTKMDGDVRWSSV
ncbi:MAG: hypothetical protein MZV70_46870 [Desulfobacterales bacterium]|nr:hypothetical protein [Desulfobacterales bacterium]